LPKVRLLLRLAPQAVDRPDSTPEVAYAASLHPWPGNDEAERADVESDEKSAEHKAELAWIIQITPTVVGSQEDGLKVAYSASIHPFVGAKDANQPSSPEPTGASPRPRCHHQIESSAAKAAAAAVRASNASQRYEKLLELIQALQTGDDRG
ncbi:MAG: hypothetical protein ACYSUQ_14565, partial [Planctomycetota bacterium]|jgi:hypothetical protein